MNNNLERTIRAYVGQNKAHIQFVQKITNEKIFVYLIMKNMDALVATFHKDIDEVRRMGTGEFAIGIVTRQLSPTQLKGITIRQNESALIAKDSQEFKSQVFGKAFAEVHRIFVDYTIDLIHEIIKKLPNSKKYGNLSYNEIRDKAFRDIGLNILPSIDTGGNTPEEIKNKLNVLKNKRHLIEHNNCIVDESFLRRVKLSTYYLGQKISISPVEVGEAIALVETLAEDLNKRALKKFWTS